MRGGFARFAAIVFAVILGVAFGGCVYDWDLAQLSPGDAADGSGHDDGLAEDADASGDVGADAGEDVGPPPVVACSTEDRLGCVVAVGAGSFDMGAVGLAEPVHRVTVSSVFIQRYEVTVGEYRACVAARECLEPASGGPCNWTPDSEASENHPINCVTWEQADAYCYWWGGSLPSEAQWEYAARGSSSRTYPWGDAAPTCARANHAPGGTPCVGRTAAANDSAYVSGATAEGVWQLSGNVWEWVADWYDPDYYEACSAGCEDPFGPSTGTERVIRGGGYDVDSPFVRAAVRSRALPGSHDDDVGFRCARGTL